MRLVANIEVPIAIDKDFISSRIFDSPVSDDSGHYLDSELRGTVDWDPCKEREYKQQLPNAEGDLRWAMTPLTQ